MQGQPGKGQEKGRFHICGVYGDVSTTPKRPAAWPATTFAEAILEEHQSWTKASSSAVGKQ
jgi:hypothetical protein